VPPTGRRFIAQDHPCGAWRVLPRRPRRTFDKEEAADRNPEGVCVMIEVTSVPACYQPGTVRPTPPARRCAGRRTAAPLLLARLAAGAASRGTYRIAGTGEDLRLAFGQVADQFPAVDLSVRSSCHAPADLHIPGSELGQNPQDVRLAHGCAACKCSDKALLTVTHETVAKLAGCDGLSPKARWMIEERVRDGAWRVTIPTHRVNVGRVSAYAWWEVEVATGRMVGRTEDGLHGSDSGDEENWPDLEPPSGFDAAGKLPFVAWYHGVVAHATGSVLAAMRWHKSPGFENGTREDFVRFVQANSLVFAARWWGEVGSGAFGENVNSYWSGVCLSFALQSLATRMPSIACHREWSYTLCDQAAEALKDLPGDKAKDAFDEQFGEQYRKLYDEVRKYQNRLEGMGAEPDNPVYRDVKLFFEELDRFTDHCAKEIKLVGGKMGYGNIGFHPMRLA